MPESPQKLDYRPQNGLEREPPNWWVLIIAIGVAVAIGAALAIFAFTRGARGL